MAISRESVVMLLAYNIAWERWGERGHEPGYWDYATAESTVKILQESGHDIIKTEVPTWLLVSGTTNDSADDFVTDHNFTEGTNVKRERNDPPEPRWAEPDDLPEPGPVERNVRQYFTDHSEYRQGFGVEPPVEEPVPMCTFPQKKRCKTKQEAIELRDRMAKHFGDRYEPLYPYECPAGGHWHLSHYRQGKANCPVCQLHKPAWRGGEGYWVMAKHAATIDGITLVCTGTGARVYV